MNIMIAGATSALAHEAAKHFAADKASLFLVGRNADKLEAVADDLRVRGAARIETYVLDLADTGRHQALVEAAVSTLGSLDAVLIAHGTLSDQKACEQSAAETLRELTINFTSVVSLLTILANYFERQKHGTIAVISSVAGDRGRQTNYVYGSAKGGVTTFLQGLRARMAKVGVAVVTIKPGQVDTPMTAGIKKTALFAKAAPVGESIYKAMLKGNEVVYIPGYWFVVMNIIKGIPEPIFKRLSL